MTRWTEEQITNNQKRILEEIGESQAVFAVCEHGLLGDPVLFHETTLHGLIGRIRERVGTGELDVHRISHGFAVSSKELLPNPELEAALKFIRRCWDRNDGVAISRLRAALHSGATRRGRKHDPDKKNKNRTLIQKLAEQAKGARSKDMVQTGRAVLERSNSLRAQISRFKSQLKIEYCFLGAPDLSQRSPDADRAKKHFSDRFGFCFPRDLKTLQFALRK